VETHSTTSHPPRQLYRRLRKPLNVIQIPDFPPMKIWKKTTSNTQMSIYVNDNVFEIQMVPMNNISSKSGRFNNSEKAKRINNLICKCGPYCWYSFTLSISQSDALVSVRVSSRGSNTHKLVRKLRLRPEHKLNRYCILSWSGSSILGLRNSLNPRHSRPSHRRGWCPKPLCAGRSDQGNRWMKAIVQLAKATSRA
jgi:hypothetical protein